jgi:hypothetical protein
MAKNWLTVLAVRGVLWGVPDAERTELAGFVQDAGNALATAKSEETRTPVATARCRETFNTLVAKMRFIKNWYFKSPPLVDSDYVMLELDPPKTTSSRRVTPKAQMTAEIKRSGTAMLFLKLVYAEGTEALANPHTDIEYQIRHGTYNPANPVSNIAAGEIDAIPDNPLQLPVAFNTRRRREVIKFKNTDSGKVAYFDIRISNGTGGEDEGYGPWCPIFNAVIP